MSVDQKVFEQAYARLADEGKCDSPGGMEYNRVLQEWRTAGCPAGVDHFIVVHANIGPDGRGREQFN